MRNSTRPDQGGRRVAFVLTQDRGGPVDVTVALAASLDARPGWTVRLFGPRPARGAESVAHLLEETAVAGKGAAGEILAARRRIRAWSPDVVHAQDRRSGLVCAGMGRGMQGRGILGRPGPARARPVVVHTYHGVPDDVTQRWLEDAGGPPPSRYTRVVLAADAVVARSVDATVVVAPPLRDFLVDRLHVPARRVVHIDNGLALPEAVLRERAVTELLFVGLLVERKGVHLLLDALAVAPAHLRLTVVGDGPQRADLEARAAALGLDGRVRFLGFRSDVPDLLAAADAFVLPSLMEQQPLVLIEAMGSGLPVVATRVGGVPDLVGDAGPSGGTLVVPPGDVGALGAALTRLAGLDAGQVGAVGRIAAQRARDRFSLATCVEQHVLLYARLSFGEPKSRLTEASGMA